ncbi:MAG: M15 family metallopeptidase [Alphaproteobacteria bacterium]|nr:M15 family metallopeptidase [Alphaproteobacteria bacterium]
MSLWPTQAGADAFYGSPRSVNSSTVNMNWYRANITFVQPPFFMRMVGPVKRFPIHVKCAEATLAWLDQVWRNAGRDQRVIDNWGMSVFSGSYCYRTMRGLQHLSMHAYGCAMDFDAPRNSLHDTTPHFATLRQQVVEPFLKLGGVWGGDWNGNGESADERRADGMHFQFARLN